MRHSNCSGMCNKKILRLDRKIEMKSDKRNKKKNVFSDKRKLRIPDSFFDKEPSIIHVDNFQSFHRKI